MKYYVGWDVGAWNCNKHSGSQDAFVILATHDNRLKIHGTAFRGPLREEIASISSFPALMNQLCGIEFTQDDEFLIGIDTPLGLPEAVQWHVTGENIPQRVDKRASHNVYIYRKCEQLLSEKNFPPLSAIKDMIGSQFTKGMHFLRKLNLKPQTESVGVWENSHLKAIEVYPATCKITDTKGFISLGSETLQKLFSEIDGNKLPTVDEQDALYCALVAFVFDTNRDQLVTPPYDIPKSEGWIWYPKDSIGRKTKKKANK
jgi:hypothetical protein